MVPTATAIAYPGGVDGIISASQGAMFSHYTNRRLCVAAFQQSTVINVQQLVFENSNATNTTANGGAPVRRRLVDSGVTGAECTGLASMLDVPSSQVVNVKCTTLAVNGQAYITAVSGGGSPSGSGGSSPPPSPGMNAGSVAGIVIGVVGGLAVLAAATLFFVNRSNKKRQAVSHLAEDGGMKDKQQASISGF